jgi:hypothetical protein
MSCIHARARCGPAFLLWPFLFFFLYARLRSSLFFLFQETCSLSPRCSRRCGILALPIDGGVGLRKNLTTLGQIQVCLLSAAYCGSAQNTRRKVCYGLQIHPPVLPQCQASRSASSPAAPTYTRSAPPRAPPPALPV